MQNNTKSPRNGYEIQSRGGKTARRGPDRYDNRPKRPCPQADTPAARLLALTLHSQSRLMKK